MCLASEANSPPTLDFRFCKKPRLRLGCATGSVAAFSLSELSVKTRLIKAVVFDLVGCDPLRQRLKCRGLYSEKGRLRAAVNFAGLNFSRRRRH